MRPPTKRVRTGYRDFPFLWTRKGLPASLRSYYGPCPVCNLMVPHRVRDRHRRACGKRKAAAPLRWRAWWYDMHGTPEARRTLPHERSTDA